jgi:Cap4 SAVED domain
MPGNSALTTSAAKDETLSLSALVASLQNDFSSLGALIKTLGQPAQCLGGNVTIRAHYLPFRNGKPRVGELLDEIRSYICNFAMHRAEIEKVHTSVANATDQERLIAYMKLRDEAADLFIKAQKSTSRNGECGELLLYLLTEWILEAPQIMAKMSLKTNASMPVHGSDGIHVKYDPASDTLIFFWGEAKLHSTVSGAIASAVTSIASTLKYDKLKEDINLVRRYVSLSGLSATAQKRIVEFLDPLSSNYDKKIDASVCLIGFDFDGFGKLAKAPASDLESTFAQLLGTAIISATKDLEDRLAFEGVTHHRMEVFFLPVESVDLLRKDWQNRIGWKS